MASDEPQQEVERGVDRNLACPLVDQDDPLRGVVHHDPEVGSHRFDEPARIGCERRQVADRIASSSGSMNEWAENDSTRSWRNSAGMTSAALENA